MTAFKDLTGKVFGKLTVIEFHGIIKGKAMWLCECSCADKVKKVIYGGSLTQEYTKSCGCYNSEALKARGDVNGRSATPEYWAWWHMVDRCENVKNKYYEDYGGRGIKVCEDWLDSFQNFYDDMGPRPGKGYSIEREDNDDDYCPENCVWATKVQQQNNRRNTQLLTYQGKIQSVSQWGKELGLNVHTLFSRINLGWNATKVLSTPARQKRKVVEGN